ncbi:hypothetical protein FHS15_002002 [Paenibacillus castaneae]|nr:hypothetical protein [Paenibacillus castaneae]NIK76877.1 hypothetical protein [Paenibacillus castaneae]
MPFPTHIVAAGGFVEDKQGNILLVKTRDGGLGLPWWTSGSWRKSRQCW